MSCGEPHEMDCSEVLNHLYEYLDKEMPDRDCEKFQEHFDECSPCLEKYGLEQEVKKLVKRCCGQDDVPTDLRSKVMGRIDLIRAGEPVPEYPVSEQPPVPERAETAGTDTAGQKASESAPADSRKHLA